jgi:hypothetical protein
MAERQADAFVGLADRGGSGSRKLLFGEGMAA